VFWDKPLETIDCRSLQILQLDRINTALERIAATPGYKSFYDSKKYKIKPLSSLEQMKDLPFTTKQDLRNSYPSGFLVTDMEKVVRMHSSSGTTGIPTVIYHTKNDIDNWSSLIARCLCMIGMSDKDVFQNMMTYGMFTGGLGLHYGAEKLGAMVIPAGAGNTERQLKFIKDFKTTVVHITPSYALHVSEIIEQRNLLDGLSLRIALMGAEPYTEATRLKLEERLRIDVINSYGLSEMNGPGVAFECLEKEGMHVWEDNYYVEIVDTKTGMPLPDGEEGELVLSAINREAMPILRYRTHDLAFIYPERCACGRTHRKISRIKGRTDDMFIIGGVNIFPSQIEEVLMKLPQVGSNYVIILSKKGSLDKLSVRIEVNPDLFAGDLRHLTQLKETITRKLREEILINPTIELVEPGSLPPSQGKAVRVIDNRDKTL
jgi:phenylacetate-CoA ligase